MRNRTRVLKNREFNKKIEDIYDNKICVLLNDFIVRTKAKLDVTGQLDSIYSVISQLIHELEERKKRHTVDLDFVNRYLIDIKTVLVEMYNRDPRRNDLGKYQECQAEITYILDLFKNQSNNNNFYLEMLADVKRIKEEEIRLANKLRQLNNNDENNQAYDKVVQSVQDFINQYKGTLLDEDVGKILKLIAKIEIANFGNSLQNDSSYYLNIFATLENSLKNYQQATENYLTISDNASVASVLKEKQKAVSHIIELFKFIIPQYIENKILNEIDSITTCLMNFEKFINTYGLQLDALRDEYRKIIHQLQVALQDNRESEIIEQTFGGHDDMSSSFANTNANQHSSPKNIDDKIYQNLFFDEETEINLLAFLDDDSDEIIPETPRHLLESPTQSLDEIPETPVSSASDEDNTDEIIPETPRHLLESPTQSFDEIPETPVSSVSDEEDFYQRSEFNFIETSSQTPHALSPATPMVSTQFISTSPITPRVPTQQTSNAKPSTPHILGAFLNAFESRNVETTESATNSGEDISNRRIVPPLSDLVQGLEHSELTSSIRPYLHGEHLPGPRDLAQIHLDLLQNRPNEWTMNNPPTTSTSTVNAPTTNIDQLAQDYAELAVAIRDIRFSERTTSTSSSDANVQLPNTRTSSSSTNAPITDTDQFADDYAELAVAICDIRFSERTTSTSNSVTNNRPNRTRLGERNNRNVGTSSSTERVNTRRQYSFIDNTPSNNHDSANIEHANKRRRLGE